MQIIYSHILISLLIIAGEGFTHASGSGSQIFGLCHNQPKGLFKQILAPPPESLSQYVWSVA